MEMQSFMAGKACNRSVICAFVANDVKGLCSMRNDAPGNIASVNSPPVAQTYQLD